MQRELEVIVVLGCRIDHAARPSPAARRRIARAAGAWHEGKAAKLLVSGGRRWRGVSEAEAMARALAEHGVPGSAVELEDRSLTTRENALYSALWLEQRGVSRIGLVTCDWHMPRALAHFRRLGWSPLALEAASPPRPLAVRRLRALRERASYAWARLLPAPVQALVRFFR